MIKAVFFDFDGVLTKEHSGSGGTCQSLCEAFPAMQCNQVLSCYKRHFGHLLTEHGSFRDSLDAFSKCIGVDITEQDLHTALTDVTENTEMFALVRAIRGHCAVGIITNNSSERLRLLEEQMKLPDLFDPIIVSGDIGHAKNNGTTTIFDVALQTAQCKASEALFIDNQEKNLFIPKEMGMQTYWHDDTKNDVSTLHAQLAKLGVSVS